MKDPVVNAIGEAIASLRRKRQECRALARQYQAKYERHSVGGFSLRTLNNLRLCAKLTAAIMTLTTNI